jgi:hypothetical protein
MRRDSSPERAARPAASSGLCLGGPHRGPTRSAKRHNYVLGYTVTKLHLQREGLVVRAKKRSGTARSGRGGPWSA